MVVERIGPVELVVRRGDLICSFSGAVFVRDCRGGRLLLSRDKLPLPSPELESNGCVVGVKRPAVEGVRVAAVEGVCASATACVREGRVTIGGNAFRGNEGTAGVGDEGCRFRGLGGDRFRFCRTRLGEGGKEVELFWALLWACPFALPLNLLEKLLKRRWPLEERLDVVDWDHRFRLLKPSRTGTELSCATWATLERRFEADERFVLPAGASTAAPLAP